METHNDKSSTNNNEDNITEESSPTERQLILKTKSNSIWNETLPQKISKLNDNIFTFNSIYESKEMKLALNAAWEGGNASNDLLQATGIKVLTSPFQLCMLPNILQNKHDCKVLVREIIEQMKWSRKRLDLYEFYLGEINRNCKMLQSFRTLMETKVLPWVEEVTKLKFTDLSISCSMYTTGDHLLVHDDLLENREIAFVYYLTPWEEAEEWPEEFGGCLEIFKADDKGFPRFPVCRKISPKNNQLVFFKVGNLSFHQVGEVTTFNYPRLSINGWFNGPNKCNRAFEEEPKPERSLELIFQAPLPSLNTIAASYINQDYLKAITCQQIQERFENTSEISLSEFLKPSIFENVQKQLLTDNNLQWHTKHPANLHYYEVLDISSATHALADLIKFFSSEELFKLLHDYTDLDLAGIDAVTPTCSLEVQRWSPGNYTVMGDGSLLPSNSLDVYYYLNVTENAGLITYLCPEDDPSEEDESVLLTITPVDNSMNMVYRLDGTTRFVKYISKNAPQSKGPTFLFSCSYRE